MSSSSSSSSTPFFLEPKFMNTEITKIIDSALYEDLNKDNKYIGDITSLSTLSTTSLGEANFLAKSDGLIVGLDVAKLIFNKVDKSLVVSFTIIDGTYVKKGTIFGNVKGKIQSILTAERTVLNILQRMSGVASLTNSLVKLIPKDSKTKILDTRKTMPGLRILDKIAVKAGGGINHRYALYDMILIKDNHVDGAGGIKQAVSNAKKYMVDNNLNLPIVVETRSLDEVVDVLELEGIHRIMLDNFVTFKDGIVNTERLVEALTLIDGRITTEVSGNINEHTVAEIAATNVDFMSVGAITHSAVALDISLKIKNKL